MELNEYQIMQMLTMIFLAQETGKQEGLNNLSYLTEEQLEGLISFGIKYQGTPLDKQITSIRDIANQLYDALTSDELPTRLEGSD